ncbi:hypothetical protein, partial [Gordonia terrae]
TELLIRVLPGGHACRQGIEGFDGVEFAGVHLGAPLGVVHFAFVVNETGNGHHSMRRRGRQAGAMIQDLDEFGGGEFIVGTKARFDGML